jgi:hypothetical protein
MNLDLAKMQEMVERSGRHAPATKAFREEIKDRLNEAIVQVESRYGWTWRKRTWQLRARPDQTFETADFTYTTATRQITLDTLPSGWDDFKVADDLFGQVCYLSWLEDVDNNRNAGEFVIERAVLNATTIDLFLDPSTPAVVKPSGSPTCVIRFYRYILPPDVDELIGVINHDNDEGLVLSISQWREKWVYLDPDETSATPTVYIDDLDRPELNHELPLAFERYEGRLEPPVNTMTTSPTTGGSLADGDYEYTFVWAYAHQVSQPAQIVTATVAGADDQVNLGNLDVAPASHAGRYRWVFRRKDEGPWIRIGEISDPTTATFSDDGSFDVTDASTRVRLRDFWYDRRRHIRFWPRHSVLREYKVRYLAKPRLLEYDRDEASVRNLGLLVTHMVAADILAAAGATEQVGHHNTLAREARSALMARHLTPEDVVHVRRSVVGSGRADFLVTAPNFTSS